MRTGACCHRMHPRLLRWVGAHASPAPYGSCPAPLHARAIPVPGLKEGIVTAQSIARQGLAATRQCRGLAPCHQGRAERLSGVSPCARVAAPHPPPPRPARAGQSRAFSCERPASNGSGPGGRLPPWGPRAPIGSPSASPGWGMFGVRVYLMHGIYTFISTAKICQVKVVDG